MANINKNIIMQAGPAVANATNKAAGLSAATPEPGSIISAIQLVNGGRTIGPDSLAHFTESVRNKLLSLLVSMEPIQSGAGDPSPDNVRPISGRTGLSVYRTGENLIDYSAFQRYTNWSSSIVTYGDYPTIIDRKGYLLPVVSGVEYTISFGISASSYPTYFYLCRANGNNASQRITSFTTDSFAKSTIAFTAESGWIYYLRMGNTATESSFTTQMEKVSSAQLAPRNGNTYTFNWTSEAGTVYAGSADIVSGDIKAAPYYVSYNGETLVGPWVSSMDVYDPEGTPTTGAQVVDLGGAMTEYHITGQDIITLVGDNYIWSDSGDVTITE